MNGRTLPPAKKRTIILVSNTSWYLSNFRSATIRRLVSAGWHVVAIAPDRKYASNLEEIGAVFVIWRFHRRSLSLLRAGTAFVRLLSIYRSLRPDVVHHFTIKPVILGGIAARLLRIPGIVQAVTGLGHAFSKKDSLARLAIAGYRVALGGRAVTVFQNEDDMLQIINSGVTTREKCVLIRGSGVDVGRFSAIPQPATSGRITFLMACRMLWAKGVREYVDAAGQVRESDPNTRFLLVGDTDEGSPDAVPRDWLEALGNGGVVEWNGFQSDIRESLAAADVVVLPSYYYEGLPKSLLEGAAAGRPLISTDTSGCRDVTIEGRSGILIKPRDVTALASAMRVLARDAGARQALGKGARMLVSERFASSIVTSKTLDLYERVLLASSDSSRPGRECRTGIRSDEKCAGKE